MEVLLLRADASKTDGTGHVMRMLALAQAWAGPGRTSHLMSAGLHPWLRAAMADNGVPVHNATNRPGSRGDARQTAELAHALNADWVVGDGYELGANWQSTISSAGVRLAVFDDNVDSTHFSSDLLINQCFHARPGLYAGRAPGAQLLLGPAHAVLRREFLFAGEHLPDATAATRVLVTFGGSDPADWTRRVVGPLLNAGLSLDVVMGGHTDGGALTHHPLLTVHRGPLEMTSLMARADLAVGAAGTTMYEFARMGLPAVLVQVAENQGKHATFAHRLGVADFAGVHSSITPMTVVDRVLALAGQSNRRRSMTDAGRALVDGHGGARVVAAMLGHQVSGSNLRLTRATWDDRGMLFSWANDPVVRAQAFHRDPIAWSDHLRWLSRRLNRDDCRLFIARVDDGRGAGQVRFDQTDDGAWEITVAVAPDLRGQGLGSRLIAAGCRALAMDRAGDRSLVVVARIRVANTVSRRAFTKAGFANEVPAATEGIDAVAVRWTPSGLRPG